MNDAESTYPWYRMVSGDEIEQGDIFENCPVFSPPSTLTLDSLEAQFRWDERDVIVMSQTCDLVKNREKVTEVLLCAVWNRSELTTGHLATEKGMEEARRGSLPAYHVLNKCSLPNFNREYRIVDFRRVYSLPLGFLRSLALKGGRIQLLPPYREHLSQAFARFFMRVGLPVDVPPFWR
jgi:hypothetical protein